MVLLAVVEAGVAPWVMRQYMTPPLLLDNLHFLPFNTFAFGLAVILYCQFIHNIEDFW